MARERIARLVCPIGVGGIQSKAPAVIAAATVAELLTRDEALRAAAAPEDGLRAARAERGGAAMAETVETFQRLPGEPTLEAIGIVKDFATIRANDMVNFAIKPGEIHALLGENGAGKSTLVKILYGALQPTAGEIRWKGKPVTIANPAAARALGIGMVFQHFSLFDALTVAENIALALANVGRFRRPEDADHHRLGRLRPAAQSGRRRRRPLGRRAPARRDRPLPAAGAAAHHHGRADLGADAAGGRRPVRDAEAPRLGRRARSSTSATGWKRCARSATTRRSCATARWSPNATRRRRRAARLASLMVGAELRELNPPEPASGDAPVRLAVRDLSMPRPHPFAVASGRRVAGGARRRDRLDRRRRRQRPGRVLRRAVRRDHRRQEPMRSRIDGKDCGRRGVNARRRLNAAFVPEERLGHGAVPRLKLSENVVLTRHGTGEGLVRLRRRQFRQRARHRRQGHRRLRRAQGLARSGGDVALRRQPAEIRRRPRVRPASPACSSSASRPGASTPVRRPPSARR